MEAHARAPDPLTTNGDMASNWQSWKEDFIIFMKITGYIDKPNDIRANFLKNRIGKVGIDAIQSMSFDKPEDKDDMDILITKLEEYFNPPKNEVIERYQFFTKSKKSNETIEQYINNLREKAKTCNFNDMTESIIRDKIILDTHDKILRKILFEAENLDLQKIITIYNDYNINVEKMKQVTKENRTEEVNFVQKPPQVVTNNRPPCWRCAHHHPQGKCPAWGSKCTKCGDVNHFTHCCKGFKPCPKKNDNNKVNKNLLNTAQPKFDLKRNDNWNNQTNPKPTAVNSKMSSFPDIPTKSGEIKSLVDNDTTSDLVMLDACTPYSNLNLKSAKQHSAHSSKTLAHPNYSNMRETKPEVIITAQTVRKCMNTSGMPNNRSINMQIHKNPKSFGKKKDEDNCILC